MQWLRGAPIFLYVVVEPYKGLMSGPFERKASAVTCCRGKDHGLWEVRKYALAQEKK